MSKQAVDFLVRVGIVENEILRHQLFAGDLSAEQQDLTVKIAHAQFIQTGCLGQRGLHVAGVGIGTDECLELFLRFFCTGGSSGSPRCGNPGSRSAGIACERRIVPIAGGYKYWLRGCPDCRRPDRGSQRIIGASAEGKRDTNGLIVIKKSFFKKDWFGVEEVRLVCFADNRI